MSLPLRVTLCKIEQKGVYTSGLFWYQRAENLTQMNLNESKNLLQKVT